MNNILHRPIKIAGKSYKTERRAIATVASLLHPFDDSKRIRYCIHQNPETGRFHPVFVGREFIPFIHQGFMVIA